MYNLERNQHFHRPYQYGSLLFLIVRIIARRRLFAERGKMSLKTSLGETRAMEFSVSKSDLVRELGLIARRCREENHDPDPVEHSG